MYAKTSASNRPGSEQPKNHSSSESRAESERKASVASERSWSGDMMAERVVLRISAVAALRRAWREGSWRIGEGGR